MKVKTSEAKRQMLDYLVAQAAGMKIYRSKSGRWMTANYGEFNHRHGTPWFEPTISWAQGGAIIERERIGVVTSPDDANVWIGSIFEPDWKFNRTGLTPLIAAMRCYVASKLGDEVEVPDELA